MNEDLHEPSGRWRKDDKEKTFRAAASYEQIIGDVNHETKLLSDLKAFTPEIIVNNGASKAVKDEPDVEEERDLVGMLKLVLSFAGPALVIWFSSPLMSLIDTAVIGRGSSLELAALGRNCSPLFSSSAGETKL